MTDNNNPLRHCFESGHFAITAELTPPRGSDFSTLKIAADILKPVVTAVNLTDGAGARIRMSSLPAAIYLKQNGVEPIMQMTCRDRNRIAIQSDLLGAAGFGIFNVLALTGDGVDAGDDPDAKAVFDFGSKSLLSAINHINETGTTVSGAELSGSLRFLCGTADAPKDPDNDWVPDTLKDKADAGASFVQTQYCYDMEVLARYMARLADHGLTERLHFLIGLGPLRSGKGARWMRDNLIGTIMPDGIIRRMEAARDPRHEGIAICAELMQQAREVQGVSGAHLMAPGLHQEIVEAINIAGMT